MPTSTLSREDVRNQLAKMVEEALEVPAEDFVDEARWVEDLDADSLDLVDVGLTAKQKFGVTIPKDVMPELPTVGAVVDYIVENLPKS